MDFYLGNYHSDLFQTCIGNTTVWKYFSNVFSIKLLALLKLPLRLTPMWKLHKILPNQHFTSLHQNFSWMENWIVWIMTRSMSRHHLISEACDDHEAQKIETSIGNLILQSSQQKWKFVSQKRRGKVIQENDVWIISNVGRFWERIGKLNYWWRWQNSAAAAPLTIDKSTSGGIDVINASQCQHHHYHHHRRRRRSRPNKFRPYLKQV